MVHHPSYIHLLFLHVVFFFFFFFPSLTRSICSSKCGSIDVRYPFGSGYGCGSPHFFPSVTCTTNNDDDGGDKEQLILTTHTGKYPITSVSYSASTLTISPPLMSTCSSMHPSCPGLGLDWSAPFQLATDSSVFILLACPAPTSALASRGNPICDAASGPRLCGPLLQCPAVAALGLPLFAPTNTCCVYSPAGLSPRDGGGGGELDVQGLGCAAYVSVASLGATPMDASTWEYGVVLKYAVADIEVDGVAEACAACERSDGVCGYAPPRDYFVCVCKSGVNTSTDCYGLSEDLKDFWQSSESITNYLIAGHGILLWRSLMLALGYWFLVQ